MKEEAVLASSLVDKVAMLEGKIEVLCREIKRWKYGEIPSYRTSNCIIDIHFDEEDIVDTIGELNATSASGPDGFPAILLKKCCSL